MKKRTAMPASTAANPAKEITYDAIILYFSLHVKEEFAWMMCDPDIMP